jgi:2-aminoadipate transaminase
MQTPWDNRYAQRTQRMGSSAIRELLKLTEQPDIISFDKSRCSGVAVQYN